MLTIQNQASQMYAWSETNRTMKYNPKVYLSVQESVGTIWLYHYENGEHLSPTQWPERKSSITWSF